jgi:hypothetical protein
VAPERNKWWPPVEELLDVSHLGDVFAHPPCYGVSDSLKRPKGIHMHNLERSFLCQQNPRTHGNMKSQVRTYFRCLLGVLLLSTVFQAAMAQNVPVSTTVLSVASGSNPVSTVISGSAVTLTAAVQFNGAPVTPGQVTFCDSVSSACTGMALLGAAQLTGNGTAILTVVPAIGTHSYKAVFVGTHIALGSASAAFPLTVTGTSPTTTTLATTRTVSSYSLTASVAALGTATMTKTNAVSFLDTTNSQTLGVASLGDSSSSFNLNASSLDTGSEASDGIVADFNNDGKPDIAIESSGDVTCGSVGGGIPYISISLGNGDGTFTTKTQLSGTQYCSNLAVGDFNNDGNVDLVLGNGTLLLGNGDGTFTITTIPGLNEHAMVVGDFNGDGNADIIGIGGTVLLGQGNGSFTNSTNAILSSAPYLQSFITGDFNGDGKLDLAAVGASYPSPPQVIILVGNGDGTFQAKTPVVLGSAFSLNFGCRNLAVGDFNGDGKNDLAVVGSLDPNKSVALLLGDGTGNFTGSPLFITVSSTLPYDSNSSSIVARDFNKDGKIDIATLVDESNMTLLLGNGDGSFTPSASLPSQSNSSPDVNTLLSADFNGDGVPDLISVNSDSGYGNSDGDQSLVALSSFTQTSSATLNNVVLAGTGSHNVQATYAGDAIFSTSTSNLVALSAQSLATALTLAINPSSSVYGQQVVLTAVLSPYSNASLTTNGEAVTFYDGPTSLGTGTLSGGLATFSTTSLPVNPMSNNLKAVYGGDANFPSATSPYITGSSTPAVSLTVTPSGQVAYGQTVSISATAAPTLGVAQGYTWSILDGSTRLLQSAVSNSPNGFTTDITSYLSSGPHSLTAVFSSNFPGYTTGTSNVVNLTLNATTPTISFSVGNRIFGSAPFSVSASSNSPAAITYSVVSGPATMIGSTVTLTGAGTVVLKASQVAASTYSTGSQNATFTVAAATPVVTLISSANPVATSISVTFTATVSSTAGVPTGSVSFLDGTTSLGQVTLANGAAILVTSALAAGTHAVTAIYNGDSNFAGVTSSVLNQTVQGFSLSSTGTSGTSQTVPAGGTATYTFSAAPVGSPTFPTAVSFAVTGLPSGATGTFTPQTIAAGSAATNVTLIVQVPTQSAALRTPGPNGDRGLPTITLGLLFLPLAWKRRRLFSASRGWMLALLLTGAAAFVSGCSGGGNSTTTQSKPYTLVVTASSGVASNTANLMLIVQ